MTDTTGDSPDGTRLPWVTRLSDHAAHASASRQRGAAAAASVNTAAGGGARTVLRPCRATWEGTARARSRPTRRAGGAGPDASSVP